MCTIYRATHPLNICVCVCMKDKIVRESKSKGDNICMSCVFVCVFVCMCVFQVQ